jgi:LysM repeat protein
MPARRGQAVARVAAPLAFLLLAILGVVAIRSALDARESGPPATVGTTPTRTVPREPATTAPTQNPQARFYRVREGDTLESIAVENETTVERLQALNPGIDPVALRIGQRVRVG